MSGRPHIHAAGHPTNAPQTVNKFGFPSDQEGRSQRLDLSNYSPAVQRFWSELPETTRALGRPLTPAEERKGIVNTWPLWRWSADWADESVSGVHVNTPKSARWVVVDCDHTDVERWRAAGLPAPRRTIVNGLRHPNPARRGRHHHLWELVEPVVLGETGRRGPQVLLRLVQMGVAYSIDADPIFASIPGGGATKNALHPAYEIIEWSGARPVSLGELAAHADIDLAIERANGNSRGRGCAIADQPDHSRHKQLFEAVRHDAYREVWCNWGHYRGPDARPAAWVGLEADVLGWLEAANVFPNPLPVYDLEATARSIVRFCRHRLRPKKDGGRPGRGKLRDAVAGLPVPERQAIGGRHAAATKAAAARARIVEAVGQLGPGVSARAVAAAAGVSPTTAATHLAAMREGVQIGVHQMDGVAAARPCAGRPRPEPHGTSRNTRNTAGAVPTGGRAGMEDAIEDGDQTPHGTADLPVQGAPPCRVARWRQIEEQADARADGHLRRFRSLRPPGPEDAAADAAVPW